jgi:hypothetical protein
VSKAAMHNILLIDAMGGSLPMQDPGIIDYEWVDFFLKHWKLSRGMQNKEECAEILNSHFDRLRRSSSPEAVNDLALNLGEIARTEQNYVPVSLSSKFAFLVNPNAFMPMDTLNKKALSDGLTESPKYRLGDYSFFMEEFRRQFEEHQTSVSQVVQQDWVRKNLEVLNINPDYANERWFALKVFDTVLMMNGGWDG